MFSPQTVNLKPSRRLFVLWCCLYGFLIAATTMLSIFPLLKIIIYTVIFFMAMYDYRHRVKMAARASVLEVGFDATAASDVKAVSLEAAPDIQPSSLISFLKQVLLERMPLPKHKGWWIRVSGNPSKQFIKLLNGTTCWNGLIVLVYGRWPHQCVVITRDSVASDDDFRRLKALVRLES